MAEAYISELGDSLSHGVANTNGDRVKIIAPKLYNDGNGNHPSIATALSGKVSKTGDTMTGQLVNTMTGEAIKVSHGTGNKDAFVSAERTDQSVKVSFGVGAGGVNHGLYSNKNSNWIVKADTSDNVTVNDGKAGTTIYLGNTNVGATNKPMYLASGKISEGSLYAGGTAVTLNGTSVSASTASFYAPTGAGTARRVLRSNGSGAPSWLIPGIDYTFNSNMYATTDTKVMWAFRLKGITNDSYNNILLSVDSYFWNNQKAVSDLLYIGWSKNGSQGTDVSMAYGRVNIYSKGNGYHYYVVKNVADTPAASTVDIYIKPATDGNSYGTFYISVLNSGNRDLNDIIEVKGTYNVSLPETAVEIPINGQVANANKASNDANGNPIATNEVYYVAGTTDYAAWVANHAYAVGDEVISGGKAYTCKTAHTSGSSFSTTNWNTIATPVLKGTVANVSAIFTGMKIAYKWPITGGSSSTYLNINGWGNVYIRRNDGNTTTHLPANTVSILTYDGTYWRWADYDSNSTYSGFVCGYCSTAAGTAAKEVSATNYSASTGNTILVRFTNTNSAAGALTLKAGGITKTIKWNGTLTAAGTTSAIPAGTWPCYYDGTYWNIWTDGTIPGGPYMGGLAPFASISSGGVNRKWGYIGKLKRTNLAANTWGTMTFIMVFHSGTGDYNPDTYICTFGSSASQFKGKLTLLNGSDALTQTVTLYTKYESSTDSWLLYVYSDTAKLWVSCKIYLLSENSANYTYKTDDIGFLASAPTDVTAITRYIDGFFSGSITDNHIVMTDGTAGKFKTSAASSLTVGVAAKLGTADKGSSTKPIYLAAGVPTDCTTYAGGTAVTLNNSSKAGSTASFYAPTAGGTANYVLIGNGTTSAPTWAEKAPKAVVADYPAGFSSRQTSWTWGTLTTANGYTQITDWHTSNGSDISFAEKSEGGSSQALSVQIDGKFYQNEGQYRVLDTSNVSVPTTVPTLAWNTESTLATIDGKNIKVKLPASPDTDVKVTQTVDSATTGNLPLLAKNTTATATITDTSRFASAVSMTPSTGTVNATQFKVNEHCTMKYNSTKSSLDFTFS